MKPAASTGQRPKPPASAVVGMVGGGQLARMTAQAAISLGIELRILSTDPCDSALTAGAEHVLGSPQDLNALKDFAAGCDVVTYDHEHVPFHHQQALYDHGVRLAPPPHAALFGQDKLHARRTMKAQHCPVPDFVHARSHAEIGRFAADHGWPLVAKTSRGGYDGRGVWILHDSSQARHLLRKLSQGLLLEPKLDISTEIAVLVSRSPTGETKIYPAVETVQRDGMCREILAPAPISVELAAQARHLAIRLAAEIGAVGVIAVEMFHTADGLVINEVALRPHNSGHFTIEGAVTSQFEQHLRAVLGWPLGETTPTAPAVATVNVIGSATAIDPASRLPAALTVPGIHVHLYRKAPRPGRKLGHVTALGTTLPETLQRARHAAALLGGNPDE
jgi:5-(carboxyamino)imidazole ribonucleotide synthase